MSSSLSSVVSDLVRAQMGTSVPSSVTDEDLDRHVAELIVREAKKKAELYMQSGIRAYTSNNLVDSNAPRTNKRFLSSIIKSTDEHNKSILKAQAQAAEDLKRERREQESRQRKRRAEEAAAAERLRRNDKRRQTGDDEGWDRWDGRIAKRKIVSRDWETWDGYDDGHDLDLDKKYPRERRRSGSRHKVGSSVSRRSGVGEEGTRQRQSKRSTSSDRERSPKRKRSHERHRDGQDDQGRVRRDREDTRRHSRRSESYSRPPSAHSSDLDESHKARKRRRPRSPKYALDDLRNSSSSEPSRHSPLQLDAKLDARALKRRTKHSRKGHQSEREPLHDISDSRHSLTPMTISRSPSLSPGPHPPKHVPSKMDRYFKESYDPRLDFEPLTVPQVPAMGLVNDMEFEGWDAMLELLRLRREDKAEKKRLERLGILPTNDKVSKMVPTNSSAGVAERWNVEGVSVMDIAYSKKGTVREWDLGKEGF